MNIDRMTYRRLEPGDAEALAAFYNERSAGSKRTFRPLGVRATAEMCAEIAAANGGPHPTKYDLVAIGDGGAIVGWSFIWGLEAEEASSQTTSASEPTFGLAVADAYQGQGVGTRLMTDVMAWARAEGLPKVLLIVVQDNDVAWRLYEKQGFVRYGEHVSEDGLLYYRMRADLDSGSAAVARSGSTAGN